MRRRYAARVDENQPRLCAFVRSIGGSFESTHTIGRGFPDAVIGWKGTNYLVEIKDDDQPPSKRKLTDDEEKWHERWQGQIAVVENERDIARLIGFNASEAWWTLYEAGLKTKGKR